MTSRLDKLERLVQLRDAGALTPEEFEAEKANILGTEEVGTAAAAGPGLGAEKAGVPQAKPTEDRKPSTQIASHLQIDAPTADELGSDELSWNPFARPANVTVAEQLSRFGLFAGAILIIEDVILLGYHGLQSLNGEIFEDGTTYSSFLLPVTVVVVLFLAVDVGLTLASWRGRSRWSAIALLILSVVSVAGSMLEILDGRTAWRVVQLAAAVAALFFSVQAIRGAFWLRAMGGMASLRAERAKTERAMGQALNEYLPPATRRKWLIGGSGLAVLVAAVAVLTTVFGGDDSQVVPAASEMMPAQINSNPTPAPTVPPIIPSVPGFPPVVKGEPFAQARRQLIAAGYAPLPINLNGNCPGEMCEAYPEVMECAGMGVNPQDELYASCMLRFIREADGAWIVVRTTGEYMPDYAQDVDFLDMAVINDVDRETVANIERYYANSPSY